MVETENKKRIYYIKYWIRIVLMEDQRLVKKIYKNSKFQYKFKRVKNWCTEIHRLLIKYGFEDLWQNENSIQNPPEIEHQENLERVKFFWYNKLRKRIQEIEEKEWLTTINNKPKLRTYKTFKSKLQLEQYLSLENNKEGRYILTRIRSGTNELRIETGRHQKPIEKEHERVCRSCMSGEIEDERHFILDCTSYEHLREEMYARNKIEQTYISITRQKKKFGKY